MSRSVQRHRACGADHFPSLVRRQEAMHSRVSAPSGMATRVKTCSRLHEKEEACFTAEAGRVHLSIIWIIRKLSPTPASHSLAAGVTRSNLRDTGNLLPTRRLLESNHVWLQGDLRVRDRVSATPEKPRSPRCERRGRTTPAYARIRLILNSFLPMP